ncbi:arylsulfatase [Cupriavidus sp. CV2]|uniref:arylsulfatase n=1 Tax=Cupriavidus ulmosensis TaxID=3065913 RepID=UPI00296AE6CD|nr:arylsulfatase [Cupriavidus sp. CV2]MDW3682328.1 arylsulfatase [Cupriavidus sp. CV2]
MKRTLSKPLLGRIASMLVVAGIVLQYASAAPVSALPKPTEPFKGVIAPNLSESKAVWPTLPEAPANAPNILLIMTDDVGFGVASTFGGPVPTPNLDRLAAHGLRYNNFHTTAMCSPTRAALLTGRNHHAVSMGALSELSMGFPGYYAEMPKSAATVARILGGNGYSTAFFGKHHNVPAWASTAAGPFDVWPTGLGFDYFFGFVAADTDQFRPKLFRGTSAVVMTDRPAGRMLDTDLADDAIRWIHNQKAAAPKKPFFAYFATGSGHAPQQAPADWIAKFRGAFDAGWDAVLEGTVARQKEAGLVPVEAKASARPRGIPEWNSLSKDEQRRYARYMEVFAAAIAYQDAEIGRLLDELDRMGERDNTLVMFIEGDNGASGEGGPEGSPNELARLVGEASRLTEAEKNDIDRLGGPDSYEVYPAGWAWAMNAPFPFFKQIASHLGGTRNGMVASWPKQIKDVGQIRTQFEHVVDVAPTILEVAGVQVPDTVDGIPQQPFDGQSMAGTFTLAAAPELHKTQYFELLGNRAIYHDGWIASTTPERMPWENSAGGPPDKYKWELYNLRQDFAQSNNLADKEPSRLKAMQELWEREARKNNVYPLRASLGALESARLRRPVTPRSSYVFWGPGVSLPWSTQPSLARGPFQITADIAVPASGGDGVVLATGSSFGGWSFFFDNGRLNVLYAASEAGVDQFRIAVAEPLPAGPATLVFKFVPDTNRTLTGGEMIVSVGDKTLAKGKIGRRALMPGGVSETFDIGRDTGVPVVRGMRNEGRFNGVIRKVEVDLAAK